jgi:hypothetical protein
MGKNVYIMCIGKSKAKVHPVAHQEGLAGE